MPRGESMDAISERRTATGHVPSAQTHGRRPIPRGLSGAVPSNHRCQLAHKRRPLPRTKIALSGKSPTPPSNGKVASANPRQRVLPGALVCEIEGESVASPCMV